MIASAAFGLHSDVLSAEPSTPDECERLVDEIKNRAKAMIKTGNYPQAEALYTKAITVLPSAILFANRSLVRLNLSKPADALADANEAIVSDASYAKGYYRKGMACMALRDYDGAVAAFSQGLEMEPEDKAFQEQLAKAKQAAAAAPAATPAATPAVAPAAAAPVHRRPTSEPAAPRTEVKRSKPNEPANDDADENSGSKDAGSDMRGYKILEDGRKTTYFNRELTEEEKALIGDIAPKKVEPAVAETARAEVGSAWNYAGTWEEKNMTQWAKNRLEEVFKDLEVNLPVGDASVRIKRVSSVVGDAQITLARGKRKHIYDFTIDLQWELEVDDAKALGTIKLIDVNADGEYEIDVEIDRQSAPSTRSLLDTYVRRSGDGLQPALVAKLMEFRDEFRQK